MKYIFRLLAFISLLISCNSKVETERPVREIKIPEGSFWVGDKETGNYFKVEDIDSHRNTAKISIYSGRNGVRWVSKRFTLICSKDNQVFIEDLEKEIKSYDGSKIYLKSGCWLQ